LNNLKNRRIQKCDYAFKQMINEEYEDDFVSEVRTTFFNFLKPFLRDLPDYFRDTKELDDSEKVFSKYFDSNKYL